jgi:hypothetical protein
MASGLYFGRDDRIKSILDSFFEDRLKEFGESNALVVVTEEQKFGEALTGLAFEVIFVEQSALPLPPNAWLEMIKKTKPGLKSNMLLVGSESDPQKIFKFIEHGWRDYIFLPPDRPLIIEKFWMHAYGRRSADIRQVYTLSIRQPATMAKTAQLEELSEFDCKLKTSFEVKVNELMILYSGAFATEDETEGQVLARCYNVTSGKDKGEWISSFYFIGASDERLKAIRSALRRSYVESKR